MIFVNPISIATCGGLSAFLLAISMIPTHNELADRLAPLERGRDKPTAPRAPSIIAQINGPQQRSRLQGRLIEAGWYNISPRAMTLRGIGAFGLGVTAGLALTLTVGNSMLGFATGALTALVAWRLPNIMLARAIVARKNAVNRELPDFLDLLSTTVEAGLALNAAMVQAVDATSGALREELESTLAEIRLGRSRADALMALARRLNEPSLTTMVTAIVQAEKLGSNIASVLQELANDTRDRLWLLAEERAARLPVKMILPMALFMIPSLYLMIFGPVIADLVRGH